MLSIDDILLLIAPHLVSDSQKNKAIELAKLCTSLKYFGDKYNYAVALRVAHILTVKNTPDTESGKVSSKREGDLSISYESTNKNTDNLEFTKYGRELLGLVNGAIMAIDIAGDCYDYNRY